MAWNDDRLFGVRSIEDRDVGEIETKKMEGKLERSLSASVRGKHKLCDRGSVLGIMVGR